MTIKVYVIDYQRKHFMLAWHDPATGKRVSISSGCTRRRDAERVASAKELELNSSRPAGDGSMPWDTFLLIYVDEHLSSLKASSQSTMTSVLSVYTDMMAPQTLGCITQNALIKYAKKLRDAKRSEATIAKHLTIIRAAVSWGFDAGHARDVPKAPRLARALAKRSKGRPLTTTEFARLLRFTSQQVGSKYGRSWRRLLRGLWLSGLRLGEALQLSWDDRTAFWIDLESAPFPLLGIAAEHEKGKQDRLLPLHPDFAVWLLRTPPENRSGFVFPLGKRRYKADRSVDYVSKTISKIGKLAGTSVNASGKFASAHDLRRSAGLRWSQKMTPAELQMMMRHDDISTTMTYYSVSDATAFAKKLWESHVTPNVTPKQK